MVDNRITKERVRHHLAYGLWKYVALVAVAVIGWNFVYTVTAYRPPAEKKLDVYIISPGADTQGMSEAFEEQLHAAFPDQEEFSFIGISLGSGDQEDPYAMMQLSTYMAAREGDLFLIPLDRFRQYGNSEGGGVFLQLDPWIAEGVLQVSEEDQKAGRLSPPEGEDGIYGVSAQGLRGLPAYLIDGTSMMWAVPVYSQNQENAVKLMAWMMEHLVDPPAEIQDMEQ